MPDVKISQAAVDALLNDITGPVGRLLGEMAVQASAVAKAKAPVMHGRNYWTEKSNAIRPPGTTKASVHPHGPAYSAAGHLYASANALADPAIFMEKPARQLHRERPFLTTGLWSLAGWLA